MTAAETNPFLDQSFDQREALQQYIGLEVILAANPRVETFYRDHVRGYRELTHLAMDSVVSFSVITEEGELRRELVVATSPDELSQVGFTKLTGISWDGAKTWTSHSFVAKS